MLGRSLGSRKWLSLVLLTVGVSVVSIPSNSKDLAMVIHDTSDHFFPTSVHELGHMANEVADVAMELTKRAVGGLAGEFHHAKRSATYEGIEADQAGAVAMNYSVGLMAVLVAAVVSGLTGVYFEKVLKDSATPVSVWTRNIQLSLYSLFPALVFGVVMNDGAEIAKHGFFDGYNWIVWTAIVLQAVGGVLASLVINYADNIAKNFATSISIVISCLFSVWFFDFKVTFPVRFTLCLVSLLHSVLCPQPAIPNKQPYSFCSAQPSSSPRRTCTAAPSGGGAVRRPSASSASRRRRSTARRGTRTAPSSTRTRWTRWT